MDELRFSWRQTTWFALCRCVEKRHWPIERRWTSIVSSACCMYVFVRESRLWCAIFRSTFSYYCCSWCKDWETFPVSDLCSRQVISSLIDRFASMPYSLVKGWFYYLITETVPYVPPTCPPSADGDTKRDAICWQFTLEYVNALNTRRNANDPVCKNMYVTPQRQQQHKPSYQRAPLTCNFWSSTTPDLNLWMCNKTSYGSGDGCHCQCGLWDPDCDNQSTQNVAGNVCNFKSFLVCVCVCVWFYLVFKVFLPGLNGTMIPCNGLCFPPGTCMNPNPCTPDASSWWLRVLPSYWPSWLTNIAFAVLVVVIVILTIFLCCRCCKSKKVPKSDYQSV